MTKNNLYQGAWKLRATSVLVLTLALSTFPLAFSRAVNAQTPTKASAQIPAKTAASPAAESKGGPKEGIKVHGHWVIDVHNPDGTLATHREFENALTNIGGQTLSAILARVNKPGLWAINLESVSSPFGSGLFNAIIVEPNDLANLAPEVSKNLSLCLGGSPCIIAGAPPPTPPPAGTFLLAGNITARQNGEIDSVSTLVILCPVDSTCGFRRQSFTGQRLAAELNVIAGQIVQVTVVISFS